MRTTIRAIGKQLDNRIDSETERLEDKLAKIDDRMDARMDELRQFLAGQLNNLQQRIDRSLDSRGFKAH